MDFTSKDLSKLPFPVDEGVQYLKEFPQLSRYPEFGKDVVKELPYSFDKVFRYIVLLYSPTTPLSQISDYKERKDTAAGIVGIEVGRLSKDESVNKVLIGYLRMMKSPKHAKLSVFYEAYWNQSLRLLTDDTISGERTDKIISNLESLESKIEKTISDLTNGDNDENVKDALLQSLEDQRLPSAELKPEVIARKLADGESALGDFNPYKKI